MKRRNADCGKLRRPIKRNKITEGMYGSSTVLYMKFLLLWAIVITADFMFMFRFEFLWPFWLLLRSVHDSFKYKGLAFSVLFVCIAITSDLVCLFFIPVHWLLFAASTYVWVQYVWHTDKGICLPTIILWMLFVYLEAGIRWKDTRHMPHLDLCRPFAAHCIGYPVVTLGFGFKSYVGYRMRQRKQREVAKENEFYMQLLQQALPQEETPDEAQSAVAGSTANTVTAVGGVTAQSAQNSSHTSSASNATSSASTSSIVVTANGILGHTQAQSHHNQAIDHHTHHHNNSSGGGGGGSSQNASGGSSSHNNISITASSAGAGGVSTSISDDKTYIQVGSIGGVGGAGSGGTGVGSGGGGGNGGATSNGHIGGKSHRRSVDKDNKNRGGGGGGVTDESKHNKHSNNYQQLHGDSNSNHSSNNKDKTDWESSNYQVHQTQSQSAREKNEEHRMGSNTNSSKRSNSHSASAAGPVTNGSVLQYDVEDVVVEPVERTKGRRNRAKKDNASKDNHHQQHHNITNNLHSNNNSNASNGNVSSNANHVHNHQQKDKDTSVPNHNINSNSDASSVSSSTSSSSSSSSSSVSASTSSTISNLASKMVSKICESCLKLEADVKKYRSELSHMKQIENELRQKLESNLTTKSCLQAKQKECDELEKRIHELTNAHHADMLQLQSADRRLTEERRQKQSLDAQLNNEKKARKIAEEKAARPECSNQCKQRKQQMDEELKQMRRELKLAEDAKQMAEQHGRKWEQELRLFEAEIRNRDSNQPGTEMLMNALAAMQDKNCTLEKNLSAETRVKLDLFSALGDAKRQLEISESRRRSKEEEVLDLKAKIAQLLAVMPTDSLLPACGSAGANSMLRMNETPPLQTGPGPASPMLSSLNAQQSSASSGHQLNARVAPNSPGDYVQQAQSDYGGNTQQQQCAGVVPVSVATAVLVAGNSQGGGASNSNLDPNATVYTPKCGPGGPGGVVVVGGASDA